MYLLNLLDNISSWLINSKELEKHTSVVISSLDAYWYILILDVYYVSHFCFEGMKTMFRVYHDHTWYYLLMLYIQNTVFLVFRSISFLPYWKQYRKNSDWSHFKQLHFASMIETIPIHIEFSPLFDSWFDFRLCICYFLPFNFTHYSHVCCIVLHSGLQIMRRYICRYILSLSQV